MCVKLDFQKAYDIVELSFLIKIMYYMEFFNRFCSLILHCISSVTYSILLNGSSFGFGKPKRGIRQEDPLHPYLFPLTLECFSR